MDYHVDRITLVAQDAAVVRGSVPLAGIAGFLGGAYGEVMSLLEAQGVAPAGPPLARYTMTDDGFDIEAGIPISAPIDPVGRVQVVTLPGGSALTVLHRGPYEGVAAAYEAAEQWLRDNDWSATAPPWEAYLDEPDVPEPRTIVHVPAQPS